VGRLPAVKGGGAPCSRDGSGGESHACIPKQDRGAGVPASLKRLALGINGMQARIPISGIAGLPKHLTDGGQVY